ncbi:MAG: diacylglycerol/lipid kinase family protein [Bacillota bacterium]
MRAALILNKNAGTSSDEKDNVDNLKSIFSSYNIKAETFFPEGEEIKKTVKELINEDFDIVAAAGGDGTLNSVASVLAGTNMPMGIIPMGTLNHFAKDLGIPLSAEDAIRLIAEGVPQKVDIGEVNGNIFINNSSVGLYPKAVKLRDQHIEQLGRGKWFSMILAFLSVFTRFPLFDIKLETDDGTIVRRTPFVFIGNNEYKLDLFNLGTRETVTGGKLSLYTAHCKGRWSMLKIAILALLNRLDQHKNFDLQFVDKIRLETRRNIVEVSVDGEVLHLKPPLHYQIRPLNLSVILPREKA